MASHHYTDPKISVADALVAFGGSQSSLATALNISRQAVSDWIDRGLEFVPVLHAHRLSKMRPDLLKRRKA